MINVSLPLDSLQISEQINLMRENAIIVWMQIERERERGANPLGNAGAGKVLFA